MRVTESSLARIFLAPGALFERLRERPVFAAALALGAGLVAFSVLLIPGEVWEAGARARFAGAGVDREVGEGTLAITRVAAVLGSLLGWPVVAAATAGVFQLLFGVGMAYGGSYRQYLSVTAHALLVPALGSLLLLPLRIVTGDPHLSLHLGLLVPFGEGGLFRAFLDSLDLFYLWTYVLIGAGAAAIGKRSHAGAAIGAALGAALLFYLLVAAATY